MTWIVHLYTRLLKRGAQPKDPTAHRDASGGCAK